MWESLRQFIKNLTHYTQVLEFVNKAIYGVKGPLEDFNQQKDYSDCLRKAG